MAISLGVLVIAALPGCGRQEVSSYKVPKPDPAGMPQPTAVHGDQSQPVVPAIKWKTPTGWEEVPAGQMRAASFRVKGEKEGVADVSVIPLPGLAGSDLDNVNRWRGQVGLGPVKDDELAGLAQTVEVAGSKASLYDLAGENVASGEKTRILAAILRKAGIAWFFKMTGPDALVAAQKNAFQEFLRNLEFTGGVMPASTGSLEDMQMPASHPPIGGMTNMGLPPSHPPVGGMTNASGLPASHPPVNLMSMGMAQATPGTGSPAEKPEWSVPAGWAETAGGPFLAAKFQVKGEGGSEASVNVSTSTGTGGGVVGNVNRWRGQIGLEPVAADKVEASEIETASGKANVVDLTGTDTSSGKKLRLIGVIVPQADRTWFYKLMGDESVVAKEKDAFLGFVKGAKTK